MIKSAMERLPVFADVVANSYLIAMDLSEKHSPSKTQKIRSEHDPRITCYRWSNYPFRDCHSKALAWFVQFAIRIDLARAVDCLRCGNGFNAVIAGYPEIQRKIPELITLIRERHILDESALATIGLSLFHFPTLAPFYGSTSTQAFVREASIGELKAELENAYRAVATSALEELFPDENGDFSLPALHTVWGSKTSTAIQREAGIAEDKISRERLLVVDLTAPVTVLTSQFLACLERVAKQKISAGPGYADWEDLGVLPYIDLEFWRLMSFRGTVAKRVVPRVICRDTLLYTAENVETTLNRANKMLDTSSHAFCALQAAASTEFNAAIDFALNPEQCHNGGAAKEALARWFPRTYPHDVPRLERLCRIFPDESTAQQEILESLEQDGELDLDIAERIRRRKVADQALKDDHPYSWQEIATMVRESRSSADGVSPRCAK
jgi:hypothetical protein